MTGVLTVRKTQSNKDDDELVLRLTSTCLVVGVGKEIHRRRRRAAENLLQNLKDFVRISSHNFGKNIYHYQAAPETILSCRARGRGEKSKEQDKDSCCTQR